MDDHFVLGYMGGVTARFVHEFAAEFNFITVKPLV